jgi:hypothetical protein
MKQKWIFSSTEERKRKGIQLLIAHFYCKKKGIVQNKN